MTKTILVENSQNRKVGNVAATYAPIKNTCPSSCALRDAGCYAQKSFVGIHNARMQKAAKSDRPEKIARDEAKKINAVEDPDGKPLRLHVSGDARTNEAAKILGEAAKQWLNKNGGPVWTYTHAWRTVGRSSWSKAINVLASIDSPSEAGKARQKGYPPAVVVKKFPFQKAFKLEGAKNTRFIPCPAQTHEVTCEECRLCFDTSRLYRMNMGIAFEKH